MKFQLLKYPLIVFIFTFHSTLLAQSKMADSLKLQLKKLNLKSPTYKNDTTKIKLFLSLADVYSYENADTAIYYSKAAKKLSQKIKNKKFIAASLNELGWDNYVKNDYKNALSYYFQALKINISIKNKKGISSSYGSIGSVFADQANYAKALEYYFKALKISEQLNDLNKIAGQYSNIGNIFYAQNELEKGLIYYFKALKILKILGNKDRIASVIGNIGNTYYAKNEYQLSLNYFLEANKLAESSENKRSNVIQLLSTGAAYEGLGDSALAKKNKNYAFEENYPKARYYYDKALILARKIDDKARIAILLGNIGYLDQKSGKFKKAEKLLKEAIAICDTIGALDFNRDFQLYLSELYDTLGKYKLALHYFKKHISISDSISNDENAKKQTQMEMQYDFDKKQTADSIMNAERRKHESLKYQQEINQQRVYTYGGIAGFLLMIIVALVSYRAYRQKQKANAIITEQKLIVEEKQKDIIDSIHYAKRIQRSLLPSENYIGSKLYQLHKKN